MNLMDKCPYATISTKSVEFNRISANMQLISKIHIVIAKIYKINCVWALICDYRRLLFEISCTWALIRFNSTRSPYQSALSPPLSLDPSSLLNPPPPPIRSFPTTQPQPLISLILRSPALPAIPQIPSTLAQIPYFPIKKEARETLRSSAGASSLFDILFLVSI